MKTKHYERLPEIYGNGSNDFSGVGIPNLTAKLVVRTANKAIYLRWDGVYEVFRIKTREAASAFGKEYSPKEVYPSSEDFGSIAWCFHDEKLARERYDAL